MDNCIFKLTACEVEARLRSENLATALMRIRAIYRAYGTEYDFVSFFGDTNDSLLICLQDGLATVHIDEGKSTSELVGFLLVAASDVLSDVDIPLEGEGFIKECGLVFGMDSPLAAPLEQVTTKIQAGFDLLEKVFTKSINSGTYSKWYVELSHRVRHCESQIYTMPEICSCTVYTNEHGTALLTQLATAPSHRGNGHASRLLNHISWAERVKRFVLLSQDDKSDEFYKSYGFSISGKWYIYERPQCYKHN